MKKILSILVIVVLIFTMAVPALAVEKAEISPRWTNTVIVAPYISAGSSIYSADVIGVSGVEKISCTMILYEKGWFGNYTEVSRYSSTVNEVGYTFTKSYSYTSGKTYKLDVSTTVYKNGYGETINISDEKKV